MTYITVPIPILDPFAPPGGVPRGGGGPSQSTAQRQDSRSEQPPRLVPYISTTSTPSAIARAALEKMLDLPKTDVRHQYDTLCMEFVDYLEKCEQKGFMIKGYDTVKGKILNLPMSYNNRWGPVRRAWLADKLKRLEFWFEMQEDRPVTMITLTSYHEGLSIASAWHELNKSRGKLLKLIAKYFDSPDYFWVPEPHKSGYVHYHLAVFADVDNYTRDTSNRVGWVKCKTRQDEDIWELMDGQGIEDKFRDLWEKKYQTGNHSYGLDFSKKKDANKIQHLKNYLSKYLEKGFLLKEWSVGMLLFNAHLWETGFRMYGASTAIRKMMNIQDTDIRHDVSYTWEENENHDIMDDLGPGYAELVEHRHGSDIVWLETRMQTTETEKRIVESVDHSVWPPKKTLNEIADEIPIEKVIWYRQYIPDWLDSDFWLDLDGNVRITEPPPLYIYDWGRPTGGYYPTKQPELTERQKRKLLQDGYL